MPARSKPKATPRKKPAPKIPAMDPHVAKGLAYARSVLSGEIPACKYVKAAAQRQLDDLARAAADPAWPYVFDEGKAGRACRFLEQLQHVKGPKAGELFHLEGWQCFIFTVVFGWVKRDTGTRRFRRAYVEVPRGNGKSFMSSGVALYGLGADGEAGADVYSAATTTDQAKIVWGDAKSILTARPTLRDRMGFVVTAHAIAQPGSNSTFKPLSREAKNQDGKNIHIAVVDELHAHPTRAVWDVLITGAAKRPQSLIWTITTAGFDTAGICYEVRDGVVKMLEGAKNEQLFGIIYTLDEADRWQDETSWVKANPNWTSSIDQDTFRMTATEALQTASKETNFKTKHLNLWCNAEVAWMQMDRWDACADPALKLEDFEKSPCVDGLDLASKVDLAARAKIFWRDLPIAPQPGVAVDELAGPPLTERHYYLFVDCYLPEAAIAESRNSQYEGWAKDGYIKATPGNVLDFDEVKSGLRGDRQRHDLREVAFDPWQAQQLANEMIAEGFVMVEVRPTVQNFSAPMKELEALVASGVFHHTGNPLMRWMVSNVVCFRDEKDNIYPRKERPEKKIDGPVATFMALNRAMLAPVVVNPYEHHGFEQL